MLQSELIKASKYVSILGFGVTKLRYILIKYETLLEIVKFCITPDTGCPKKKTM